ncbi:voltage-dependent anion channel [Pholiota molesta]|nr:voltage-dependent anion channel [Pholiota molesta]
MLPLTNPKKSWHVLLEMTQISTRRANPGLFAITMGTGGISTLFVVFPYGIGSTAMTVMSLIFFFLNLFLFILFMVLVAAKYIYYPDRWAALVQNPVTSLYAGTFPMGATTLINVAVLIIHTKYGIGGKGLLYFIWVMWWLDVVIACLCTWVGVHIMFIRQTHSLEKMTAMWLLPVVTLIVASSSGAVVANALSKYSEYHALITTTTAAFIVTVGLTLALMILTIYFLRLILHGLPAGGTVLSVFLPLGPTGQAGYSIFLIGDNLTTIFPTIPTPIGPIHSNAAGSIVKIICTCLSFALWSLATMWILYALLAIHTALRKSFIAFRVSFWGLVFPNAVYANLTILLAEAFDSRAFRVWGAIYAVITLLLWISIFARSLWELKAFYTSRKESDDLPKTDTDKWENHSMPSELTPEPTVPSIW